MRRQDRRFPHEWSKEIFREAAELYAAHDKQISVTELIALGLEAGIPSSFTRKAIELVAERKSQQKKNLYAISTLIGTFIGTSLIFGAIWELPRWLWYKSALRLETPNEYHVYRIKKVSETEPDLSFIANKIDDNNVIARTVFYKEGVSGFVETVYCVLPPGTHIPSIKKVYFSKSLKDFVGSSSNRTTPVYYCKLSR